jgi:methyltransferase
MVPLTLAALVFIPMLVEARVSARHERALRAAGAWEPAGDVYRVMQIAYPACFVAIIVEAWLRRPTMTSIGVAGGALFAAAKALKYWAIATLGERWSFRVLVLPAAPMIHRGPYRFMRHPNYAAVAGELAGAALIAGAPVSGALALIIFCSLMAARIRIEERALGMR